MAVGSKLLPRETRKFAKEYELCQLIGKGSFGEVWTCRDRWTGQQFAAKLIDKATLRTCAEQEDVLREVAVMEAFAGKHDGVVRLHEALEGDSVVQLVMELCRGGDLFELLKSRGSLPEEGARVMFTQLASALAFCHAHGVVHRDIKPENILLDQSALAMYSVHTEHDEAPPVKVKLADFGLTAVLGPDGRTSGYTGSRYYTAPEMLRGEQYGCGADVWSLGVVLCTMLTGRLPFAGQSKQDVEGLRRAILRGRINFAQPAWEKVSDSAKHLVARMLSVDPAARISAEEILAHPWLARLAEQRALVAAAAEMLLPGHASQSLPGSPVDTQRHAKLRPAVSAGPDAAGEFRLAPPQAQEPEEPLEHVPLDDCTPPQQQQQQQQQHSAAVAELQRSSTPEPVCCMVPPFLPDMDFTSPGVWCFPHLGTWGEDHHHHHQQHRQGHADGTPSEGQLASPGSPHMQAPPALELGKPHRVLAPLLEFFAY